MMISSSFVLFINHLLTQESWAAAQLRIHAGKIVCFDFEVIQLRIKIASDGFLQAADVKIEGDVDSVTLRIKLHDLPLILQNRERAVAYVKIEGDADLANTVSYLSKNLRWEVEEDLSKFVGDVIAVRMVETGKVLAQNMQTAHQHLQENIAEYFLEEDPMLVRPRSVQQFGEQVNLIRDDVERLLKRIERLEKMKVNN